jgi:hypothetical protein
MQRALGFLVLVAVLVFAGLYVAAGRSAPSTLTIDRPDWARVRFPGFVRGSAVSRLER